MENVENNKNLEKKNLSNDDVKNNFVNSELKKSKSNTLDLDISEKRKKNLQELFLKWFMDPYNKVFFIIFIFSIIIRFYYFWITRFQPVWWDAGDYLTQAKILGGIIKIDYVFNPRRPFFLAVLWGFLLRLGFHEVSFRVTELIFSIVAIPGIYLVGQKMFNKKVGLISSILLSYFYLHLFYSFRLMTEIPTLAFFIFAVYFFWDSYIGGNKKSYFWFGSFFGLSLLSRGGTSVMLFVFVLFLILTDLKFRFLKNKNLWISFIIAFLVMSTFFTFIYIRENKDPISYFLALNEKTGEGIARFSNIMGFPGIFKYVNFMPTYFGIILLLPFIYGLVILIGNLIINFDLLLKNKSKSLKKDLFLFLWFFVPFIFHAVFVGHMEPRYLMMAFPPFFIILSKGLLNIANLINKYQKNFGIILLILILFFGGYYQLNFADQLIKSKMNSYIEIKQSGEWIKENSNPGDIIFSQSLPQHTYYSERKVYNIMDTPFNASYFSKMEQKYHPVYLVLSAFEAHAPWAYSYPQEHKDELTPVKVYKNGENPVVIIYKFNYPKLNNSFNLTNLIS